MNLEEIVGIVQIGTLLVAVGSLILTQRNANRQNMQLLKQNELMLKQSRFSLFAEYTRRYQDILLQMPRTVYSGEFKAEDMEAMKYMRLYFDLCSEEYWLKQEDMIPDKTWKIWLEGMQATLNRESFKAAWRCISGDYDREFSRFFRIEVVEKRGEGEESSSIEK